MTRTSSRCLNHCHRFDLIRIVIGIFTTHSVRVGDATIREITSTFHRRVFTNQTSSVTAWRSVNRAVRQRRRAPVFSVCLTPRGIRFGPPLPSWRAILFESSRLPVANSQRAIVERVVRRRRRGRVKRQRDVRSHVVNEEASLRQRSAIRQRALLVRVSESRLCWIVPVDDWR